MGKLTKIYFWILIKFLKTHSLLFLYQFSIWQKRDVKPLFHPNSKTQLVFPFYCKLFCERFLLFSYYR